MGRYWIKPFISQISVAASGSGPVVTYTFTSGEGVQALADVDETRQSGYIQINTGETGNLGTEEGSAASGIITGSLDGTEYMFWYQDGNIAYKANVNDKASYVFDPAQLPENLTKNFQVISSQTKTYILWTATASSDQDQNQKAVYGCIWEKGAFGKDIVLENLEQVLFPAFQEPLMRMASWYFPTTEQNMTKMAPQNILIWKKRQ